MKFFLDTADLKEIEEANSWGAIAGVTTNPTLYSRVGGKLSDFHEHIKAICDIVQGPVSAESVAMTRDEIFADGKKLHAIDPEHVVVKVPTMIEGLAATKMLAAEGIPVNMTLCFTVPQAILAARQWCALYSPFDWSLRRYFRRWHSATGECGQRPWRTMILAMNAKSSLHRSAARTMLPRQRSWVLTSLPCPSVF